MAFLSEPEPPRLIPTEIRPGLRRIVAPNPGPMTYHGTNIWLLDGPDGMTVIDPGPNDPAHIAAIAASGKVARIVLTHTHPDHLAGAPALKMATGAPILAWGKPWAADFVPDIPITDGARIGTMTALHTPGHASDHVCFALPGGVLFSGDHVMSWSTSIVSPPDGDMADYMASLRLLLGRNDTLYLCGHGPPLPNPLPLVRAMLSHRAGREASVAAVLGDKPHTEDDFLGLLYAGLASHLAAAARRTILAHLLKLEAEGRAVRSEAGWIRA